MSKVPCSYYSWYLLITKEKNQSNAEDAMAARTLEDVPQSDLV